MSILPLPLPGARARGRRACFRWVLARAAIAFGTTVSAACGVPASAATDGRAADEPRLEGDRLVLPAGSPNLRSVSIVAVGPGTATAPARLNGRLTWDEDRTVRVFTPLAGRVTRILAVPGQRVAAGQTLAIITSGEFGQSQADLSRAAADLNLAARSLARQRDLLAHGIVAAKDVEAAEADSIRAAAEQRRAATRLAVLGGDSATPSQGFPLKAPLGGLLVSRAVTPGQEVRPDQMLASAPNLMAPLFVITDPTHLWVDLDVPERDLGHLSVGQTLTIRPLAGVDRPVKGRIAFIGSSVDPSTRTVEIRGVVDNPTLDLKAEMLVAAESIVPSALSLQVPAKAVFLEGNRHLVFLEERTGVFHHAEVVAGPEEAGAVPVTKGLKPGDRIVVDGALLLNQLYHTLLPAGPAPATP